jgi:hypothetical protein
MDYSKMTDRSLTTLAKQGNDEATHQLYFRYKNFVYNHWSKLRLNLEKINNKTYTNNLANLKTDFENDSYVAFMDALNYTNMEKVENDKWKFLGPYGFYLSNLRRTYRRKALKGNKEMSPIMSFGEEESNMLDSVKYAHISAEDEFIRNDDEHKAELFIKDLQKHLSSEEFKISALKKRGLSISEIKKEMGITTNVYYKITNNIRAKVSSYMNS